MEEDDKEKEEVLEVFPWKPVFAAVGDIISTGGGGGDGVWLAEKKGRCGDWLAGVRCGCLRPLWSCAGS